MMQNSNAITIDLQVNKSNAKAAETEMTNIFSGLQRAADALKKGISEAFTPAIDSVQKLNGQIDVLTSVIASATLELQNLASLLTTQHEETMWSDFISQGIESLALGVDLYTMYNTLLGLTGALTVAGTAQSGAMAVLNAINTVAAVVTKAFGAAMTFLTSPIGLVVVGITALIAIIVLLIANWDTVSAKIQQGCDFIQSVLQRFDNFLQGVFATDFTKQFGAFGNVLNAFFANVENIWNAVKSIFSGIVSFVKNVFAGDWGAAWDSIVSVFKGIWDYLVAVVKAPINGIIGIINGLVQGVVDGINLVIRALNGIHFTIPDWIPGLGGMTVGFQIQPLNAPKIPYLARGAVLPANKPFLAVLGDQRHGNNIEAPEGLIRDIFKEEMGDFLGGMMAGFEALLEENRTLRAVVECIEVGDTTIGQAANRYNDKMAVVRGRA